MMLRLLSVALLTSCAACHDAASSAPAAASGTSSIRKALIPVHAGCTAKRQSTSLVSSQELSQLLNRCLAQAVVSSLPPVNIDRSSTVLDVSYGVQNATVDVLAWLASDSEN